MKYLRTLIDFLTVVLIGAAVGLLLATAATRLAVNLPCTPAPASEHHATPRGEGP